MSNTLINLFQEESSVKQLFSKCGPQLLEVPPRTLLGVCTVKNILILLRLYLCWIFAVIPQNAKVGKAAAAALA